MLLTPNTWNDFGATNMYDVTVVVGTLRHQVGRIRLCIADEVSSVPFLKKLAKGNEGKLAFPLVDLAYVSLPESIDVYHRFLAVLTTKRLLEALNAINDATYLDARRVDAGVAIAPQYMDRLMRGTSERRAFKAGRQVLRLSQEDEVDEFQVSVSLEDTILELVFNLRDDMYGNRISILVGRNGSGKTQTLKRLIEILTDNNKSPRASKLDYLLPMPTFGQVTAIAFSPYDNFPADRLDEGALDVPYLHFGFRTNGKAFSAAAVRRREIVALLRLIRETDRAIYSLDRDRFSILLQALDSCLSYDEIVLAYKDADGERRQRTLIRNGKPDDCPLTAPDRGRLIFKKNGGRLWLSAGQNNFVSHIIVLCAYLTQRSLVLIDEPELGLHPQLEVDLMRALKSLLKRFASYAIIATHSAVITREVPSSHVNVLHRDGEVAWATTPSIETFGAQLSAIVNDVFGGLDADPAYEGQLRYMASQTDSYATFEAKFSKLLSPQAMSFVRNNVFGLGLKVKRT